MSDSSFLVCPACERTEPATERVPCPACGSDRTYLNHAPALPDATSEGYVKRSPTDVADDGQRESVDADRGTSAADGRRASTDGDDGDDESS